MRYLFIIFYLFTAANALGQTRQQSSGSQPASTARQATLIPVKDVGSKVLILGELGVPIGETVTVSGEKKANGPLAEYFWVDTINGQKLSGVRGIQIKGIANWPDGTRATLSGHEFGTIRFLSLQDMNLGPGARFSPNQYVFLSFQITTIVEPNNLKLKPGN